jgi:hypothetical protein
VIELTRRWADQVVVGLRLCPFARLDETRIVCAPAGEADDLSSFLAFLRKEVQVLHDQPHVPLPSVCACGRACAVVRARWVLADRCGDVRVRSCVCGLCDGWWSCV